MNNDDCSYMQELLIHRIHVQHTIFLGLYDEERSCLEFEVFVLGIDKARVATYDDVCNENIM
jgi:hypothetical protein